MSEFFTAPISGTRVFTTSETLRNHVDFALFATSSANTAQAFASAKITCPDSWFFPDPPASCPASAPHDTLMQAEHFERGLMLWPQWNHTMYYPYPAPYTLCRHTQVDPLVINYSHNRAWLLGISAALDLVRPEARVHCRALSGR